MYVLQDERNIRDKSQNDFIQQSATFDFISRRCRFDKFTFKDIFVAMWFVCVSNYFCVIMDKYGQEGHIVHSL